jgi:two-component sensor histidine kinase
MAVHELTTKVVKYGGLSFATGTVSVRWRPGHTCEGNQLFLDWIQNNGPRVTPPERHAFGFVLIERGLRPNMSANVKVKIAVSASLTGNLPAIPENR